MMPNIIRRAGRAVKRVLPDDRVTQLEQRVIELERDLDEYRRDHLRVAELADQVESMLTPPQGQ